MNPENEGDSLFSKFKKTQGSGSVPNGTGQDDSTLRPLSGNKPAAPAPVPNAAQAPGAPVVPTAPAAPARGADNRETAALEAAVSELKEELTALKGAARQAVGAPFSVGAEARLAVRMERSENLIAELKVLISSQQAQLNKYAEAKLVSDGLGEYLRDLVARLNAKLTDAVNTMHLTLSDLSARLTGSEAIYGKMFSDAEDRMKKSLDGEITAMNAQVKTQRDDTGWLSHEFKISMDRRVRALEGKCSDFEAIARRMDRINAALKKGS